MTQQLAAKSPGAGKLLVALTREQAAHAIAIIGSSGECDCCCQTMEALRIALKESQ
jgi:hypothetical protein